jgi:hypothetical protein
MSILHNRRHFIKVSFLFFFLSFFSLSFLLSNAHSLTRSLLKNDIISGYSLLFLCFMEKSIMLTRKAWISYTNTHTHEKKWMFNYLNSAFILLFLCVWRGEFFFLLKTEKHTPNEKVLFHSLLFLFSPSLFHFFIWVNNSFYIVK